MPESQTPISFNKEMINAITSGRKTETRRIAKIPLLRRLKVFIMDCLRLDTNDELLKSFRYGSIGSQLCIKDECDPFRRIKLVITDIRLEHLNDINEVGALAEGVDYKVMANKMGVIRVRFKGYDCGLFYNPSARNSFISLWQKIYGDLSWYDNPLVWVISFSVVGSGRDEREEQTRQ